jgi:hypothetical protein
MSWCLLPEYANKFKQAIISGEINPDKLMSMTSVQRREFLGKYVGEWNAKYTNTLFESKLLLKNQQAGMITWAKKLSGIKETQRTDLIAKINKLDKALSPENENEFLSDIVEQRLGVKITASEGKTIVDLTQKIESLHNPNLENWRQSKEYWQARQELTKFIRDSSPETIPTTAGQKIKGGIANIISIERAIKTGFDLSAVLRQGRALFGTKEWMGAARRMFSYAKNQTAMDNLEVDIMSNRYSEYVLQNKKDLGLTLLGEKFTQREEQFASKLIDKIPLLRGSERAFTGFLNDLRFNRFVNILDNLDKAGKGITDSPAAMNDLAKVVGASTGRGTLGSAEGAARSLATVLFSPRWIASRVELLLNPIMKTGPARTEATKSLARLAGTSVAILGMAALAGADVEDDPRSADFGKFKIGNTRFDITGGLAPYITLISRIITKKSKSTTTGIITELNSGKYGSQTGLDVVTSFFENKTSPFASVVKDMLKGESFEGKKIELNFTSLKQNKDFAKYLFDQLITPLITSDTIEAFTDASGGALLGSGAFMGSLFGIGTQTYSADGGWDDSTSKEFLQFGEKLGEEKLKIAGDKFNLLYNKKLNELKQNTTFKSLEYDYQQKVLTDVKSDIKEQIFDEYGFIYENKEEVLGVDNIKKLQAMPKDEREMIINTYSEDTQARLRDPSIIFRAKLYEMSSPFNTKSEEEKTATIKELKEYLDEFDIDYPKAKSMLEEYFKEEEKGMKDPYSKTHLKTVNERLGRLKEIFKN